MILSIIDRQKKHTFHVQENQNLLEFLRKHGFYIPAPCGGKGTCRKCQVEAAGIGVVLACRTLIGDLVQKDGGNLVEVKPDEAVTVILPEPTLAQISSDGLMPDFILSPHIYKASASLPKPSLSDQRPEDERFRASTGLKIPFRLLPDLPRVLDETDFKPAFYFRPARSTEPGEVLRFVQPASPEPLGIAIDIGTTTLAAWLYDLSNGKRLAAAASLNPQQIYGADVISRIDFASASPDNQRRIQDCIFQAILHLAEELASKAEKAKGHAMRLADICHFVITGNTTMMHLLTGLPASAIARAPFIPVSRLGWTLLAAELGFPTSPDALCQIMPAVASYVGADITAGILACGMNRLPFGQPGFQPALLLDIGTNGEIVLAGPQGLIACSTAAGPAFEGANIQCGMGGVTGAIDEFSWHDDQLTYTLINNGTERSQTHSGQKARGICGSGLVAALAILLDLGLIEPTGRIADKAGFLPESLAARIIEYNSQPAIVLVEAGDSASGEPIILTQKDIREVQNAKAAIAAGVQLLISQAGLNPGQIGQVYLAGGFGNYLDVMHAFRIGMLPDEFRGKTRAVGNSAGMGAVLCLLESDASAQAEQIAHSVHYFELSADRRFTDLYVDAMLFPEPET